MLTSIQMVPLLQVWAKAMSLSCEQILGFHYTVLQLKKNTHTHTLTQPKKKSLLQFLPFIAS